jgi:hypothetical protein
MPVTLLLSLHFAALITASWLAPLVQQHTTLCGSLLLGARLMLLDSATLGVNPRILCAAPTYDEVKDV